MKRALQPHRRRSHRPQLEVLEDRTLLSVYTVDRLTDLGEGTDRAGDLRSCISQATDGDTIQFSVTGRINLTGALPDVTKSVTIEGPGPDSLSVRRDTGGVYRIFAVTDGPTVIISGLTITNGLAEVGSGILNRVRAELAVRGRVGRTISVSSV